MATERTSFSSRKQQPLRVVRPAGIATRLQDCVLLRAERGASDVLGSLDWETELLRASEENFFLNTHRSRFDRQSVLNPLVIRQKFAVTEWKQMIYVVVIPVCALVICENTRCGPRRVSLVVVCCSTYAGELDKQCALR